MNGCISNMIIVEWIYEQSVHYKHQSIPTLKITKQTQIMKVVVWVLVKDIQMKSILLDKRKHTNYSQEVKLMISK